MAGIGSKPGERRGGRQKGTRNKLTQEIARAASEGGITPLEYMLRVLRDETETPERRDWAAEKAAPYMHPRLASADAKVKGSVTLGELVLGSMKYDT
jgi:hypothetical protein